MVSTNAMMKMVSTTGKNPQVSALWKSSLRRMGEKLGGKPTQALGGAATPVAKARNAVARIPTKIAAGKRRIISTAISRNPKIATKTGTAVR